MNSATERALPQSGPGPEAVPVKTDKEHRQIKTKRQQELEAMRAETSGRLGKLPILKSGARRKGTPQGAAVPGRPTRGLGSPFRFIRTGLLSVHRLLLGSPPDRVMSNKPPFRLLSVHRWVYFWLYVTLRVYKARALHWMPIPRPSVRYRMRKAVEQIQDVQFHKTKVIASFSMKGGVGKTSLAKLKTGLIKRVRKAFNVLVQDNNPDRGTLADRGRRTVKHSVEDLVDNIDQVETAIDFSRYCTELEEGALMLASTRPGEFSGELDITEAQFDQIITLEEDFFDVVILDCGTDRKRETNLRALQRADVIHLVSTPAKDSVYQAVATYVWMCKHPVLRHKHIVLEVNRKKWWHNLDKIQDFFIETVQEEFAKDENRRAIWRPISFQTFGVSWDLRLALGLNFTSFELRRAIQADEFEVLARSFELVADGFVSLPDSQLTHLETAQRDFDKASLGLVHNLTHDDVIAAIQSAPASARATSDA
jgi:MinD-like ATPase involved in chromosome partitioning or flagellar assembly